MKANSNVTRFKNQNFRRYGSMQDFDQSKSTMTIFISMVFRSESVCWLGVTYKAGRMPS